MVIKVHCGTAFGDKFAAMLKMRPPKQSHSALQWQPFPPQVPRNLKVANSPTSDIKAPPFKTPYGDV